jgi:RimJ/RimL family protein N-acetyltransferase
MEGAVTLRPIEESDLAILFEQQLDPIANQMAAFTAKDPTDRAAFDAHWARNLANLTNTHRTILLGDQVAGSIVGYEEDGHTEIGYWLGREYWGQGVATRALKLFLAVVRHRPIFARVAYDNVASLHVLQTCGFTVVGTDHGFANARNATIEEFVLRLDAEPA